MKVYDFRLTNCSAIESAVQGIVALRVGTPHVRDLITDLRAQADDLERRADADDMDDEARFQNALLHAESRGMQLAREILSGRCIECDRYCFGMRCSSCMTPAAHDETCGGVLRSF